MKRFSAVLSLALKNVLQTLTTGFLHTKKSFVCHAGMGRTANESV